MFIASIFTNSHLSFIGLAFITLNFLISFLLLPLIVILARKLNRLELPNRRSSHSDPIPALGGIAIYFGFIITFILLCIYFHLNLVITMLSTSLLFVLGLLDDLYKLRAWCKLIVTTIVSLFIVLKKELIINDLHGFMHINELHPAVAISGSILFIIFIVHAINLIDGVDGLASGLGIISLSLFSYCFYRSGYFHYLILTIPTIVSLTAFLVYNFRGKRFKIFMGDSGSLFLGFIIAITVIRFMQIRGDSISDTIRISPVTVFALLIVPVFDLLHVFIKRIIKHKSPFFPDKEHIHHTLLKLGFTHKVTTLLLIGYTLLCFLWSQYMLQYLRSYWVLLLLIFLSIVLWNILEMQIGKNLRKYAKLRSNFN